MTFHSTTNMGRIILGGFYGLGVFAMSFSLLVHAQSTTSITVNASGAVLLAADRVSQDISTGYEIHRLERSREPIPDLWGIGSRDMFSCRCCERQSLADGSAGSSDPHLTSSQ